MKRRRLPLFFAALVTLVAAFAVAASSALADDPPPPNLTIPLNNDTAEEGSDCPAEGGPYWHFVISPNNGESAFIVFHLNLGDASTYDTSVFIQNAGQWDNVFVAVPSGKTLTSLIKDGSTADIYWSGNGTEPAKFQLSHTCSGTRPPAADATVSKDANGSYDETFKWTIEKKADKTRVLTAGGAESEPVNYTVTVSHDGGTASNIKVKGTISVTNPNGAAITLDSVTDVLSDATSCTVGAGDGLTISANSSNNYPYECSLGSLPAGDLKNTATASWSKQTLTDGSVLEAGSAPFTTDPISFTKTQIDECTTVNDTNPAGPQGVQLCAGVDDNPKVFNYSETFKDPAGTCTPHENTASFVTNDTGAKDEAKTKVEDCQGADLVVTKDATPSFTRTYKWIIKKSASPTSVQLGGNGGQTTVSYKVEVSYASTDSDWQVVGTIDVKNPNDWESITLTGLADAIDNGGSCTVDTSAGLTIAAGATNHYPYKCTYSSAPSPAGFTNTATAKWDASAASTPNGSASGSATGAFGDPSSVIDECVSVSDSLKGSLGTVCAGDPNPKTFTYTITFPAPPLGTCAEYPNTATFTTNDTGSTGSASASVKICNYRPALTPGYWKNHLANSNSKGSFYSAECKTIANYGGSCSTQGVWAIQYLPKLLGNYSVDTITKAAQVFNAMNCGSSTDQSSIGCLAGHLLAAKLNLANGSLAAPCILQAVADADAFLKGQTVNGVPGINYVGPSGSYILTPQQRSLAISIKTKLDSYNNGSATC